MPRGPRLEMPGVPLHVTHRGVNRAATFLDDEDYAHYKQHLGDVLAEHEIALHAFVLMMNDIHLLVSRLLRGDTPSPCASWAAVTCLPSTGNGGVRNLVGRALQVLSNGHRTICADGATLYRT